MRRFFCLIACAALIAAGPAAVEPSLIDRAFKEFWDADDPVSAAKRIPDILKTGISFEDALARVRRGRDYSPTVGRGTQRFFERVTNLDHPYTVVVPDNYDATRSYQVRFLLHGGANRIRPPDPARLGDDRLPSAIEEIKVFPGAWRESVWWQSTQVENLSRIVDRLKRRYNVDENRVYLTGISDGGTGVFYMAMRDSTPWASFLPLVGSMMVLANERVGVQGEMYPGNAANKPFFVVNAGRDQLYPANLVEPYVRHLAQLGSDVVFHVQPDFGHGVAWWASERSSFEEFVADHPRDPLPDKLSWETERTDRYNRAHWLVIDRLGDAAQYSELPDSNLLKRGREYDFGFRVNSTVDRGRRILDVIADSNAHRMGLRRGDVFVDVGGKAVQNAMDVFDVMAGWEIGGRVQMTVERSGRRVPIEGTFEPQEVETPPISMFPRKRASGRVDLVRRGNVIEAKTRGVQAFTLLLSPSKFDFSRPIQVVANGRTVFDRRVDPSIDTLMKWAARDNDRMMVFGAEVAIDLMRQVASR